MNQPTARDLGFTPEQERAILDAKAARDALQTETNTNTAESEVSALMGKIRKAHCEMSRERGERAEKGPDIQAAKCKLLECGYPPRSVEKVDAMWGPGLAKAEELRPLVVAGDCLLIVFGDRGPGKTQMATWLAFQRWLEGKSCGRYVKTFDLLGEIKLSWDKGSKGNEAEILRHYQRVPLLILDEFQERGEEKGWANQLLTNLVDQRYDRKLATIIIANYKKEELKDSIPASILSRAEETGGRVWCGWPSYRQK